MNNKEFLLNLQIGMIKELCSNGLLTEEQTTQAIKEFEQAYEKYVIEKEVNENGKDEKSSSLL